MHLGRKLNFYKAFIVAAEQGCAPDDDGPKQAHGICKLGKMSDSQTEQVVIGNGAGPSPTRP
jgi:hypothetical protein